MNKLNIDIVKRCLDKYGNEYEIISCSYINTSSKIEVLHNKCGNSWWITTNNFLNKVRKCGHYGNKKSTIIYETNKIIKIKKYEI